MNEGDIILVQCSTYCFSVFLLYLFRDLIVPHAPLLESYIPRPAGVTELTEKRPSLKLNLLTDQ
jgi:hypothetical protein